MDRTEVLNDFVAYASEHHGQDVSGLVRAYLQHSRKPAAAATAAEESAEEIEVD